MRNPMRLGNTYTTICLAHQEFLPDIRIGQLFNNFHYWLSKKGKDSFYLEDEEYEILFKEYISEHIKARRGDK